MVVVGLERLAQRGNGRVVVAEAMLRVPDTRDGFGALRRLLHGNLEKLEGTAEQLTAVARRGLTKERAADLQHEVEVIGIAQLERAAKTAQAGILEAELEQRLAESG